MQKLKAIRKSIKAKFGSLSKFAALTKTDRYDLQKFFAAAQKKMTPEREQRLFTIESVIAMTKVESLPNELTKDLRKKIEDAIEDYGGVIHFCNENPQFNKTSVFHIIQGRRKKITKQVNELIQTLKINL